MAQIKISELDTLAQQLVNADYVPIVHTGVTYKFAPFNYLVKNSGNETIAGVKTFSSTPIMTIDGGVASAAVDTIQVRRDTAANWTSVNPVLLQGEHGRETDTGKEKCGDGTTAWNSLGYDNDHIFSGDAKLYTKTVTGTSPSSQGVSVSVSHGISPASKIISHTCEIRNTDNTGIPPKFTTASGYEFDYTKESGSFNVYLSASNSAGLLSQPIYITFWYQK